MQQRITFLFLLSMLSLITMGDSSEAFAQVREVQRTPKTLLLSDAIEAAHDYYHEQRYAEAIKAYEALIEKGVANTDGSHRQLQQSQKDSIRLMLGQSYAKIGEGCRCPTRFQRDC